MGVMLLMTMLSVRHIACQHMATSTAQVAQRLAFWRRLLRWGTSTLAELASAHDIAAEAHERLQHDGLQLLVTQLSIEQGALHRQASSVNIDGQSTGRPAAKTAGR